MPRQKRTLFSDLSSACFLTGAIIALSALRGLAAPNEQPVSENSIPFGKRGTERWYIQGAGAVTIDNDDDEGQKFGLVGGGLSYFFANGHSVNLELNTMAFDQAQEDALGLNLGIIFRWHLYRQENWSLYFDGGAGILGTTNQVPSAGSSFNFTPQVGIGGTINLNREQRLMMGIRWHHISNADLYENNPGRDSIMGYFGINFPY